VLIDDRLALIGIDELWGGYADVSRAFAACTGVPGARCLVLGHNPDLMTRINQSADLFLFGHTHGGQIYLPFLWRLTVPVDGDMFRGMHQTPQGPVYVSNGCGETSTPTRLAAPPEVVLITLC
jgi:predicted MPP superfamily phosphohydrolase